MTTKYHSPCIFALFYGVEIWPLMQHHGNMSINLILKIEVWKLKS